MRKYVIEDTIHCEFLGEFSSLAEAAAELRRRSKLSWDQDPNVAPCMGWKACGRCFEIIEFEVDEQPWKEIRRIAAFELSAKGTVWAPTFEGDVAEQAP